MHEAAGFLVRKLGGNERSFTEEGKSSSSPVTRQFAKAAACMLPVQICPLLYLVYMHISYDVCHTWFPCLLGTNLLQVLLELRVVMLGTIP